MKRVLIYGMTDNPGGIEAYIINLAKRLENEVIFDYVIDFKTIAHSETIESMGSRVFRIPAKSKSLFHHWREFWKILKQHPEYKTVYFNILDAGAAVTEFIPWLMGKRIVTHSHNSATEKVQLHRICRPLLNIFTDKYVACSKIASEYMFGNAEKALIIPNAIDAAKFSFTPELRDKKRKELGIGDELAVCHIGRFAPQKNPIRMLDIFKAVLKKQPNAVLISVGSGEMEQDVRRHAEDIDISNNIIFLGIRLDISEILQAADVFLFPSLYEGLSIVMLEAQAAGLGCVVSSEVTHEADITGNVEFVSLKESNDLWAEKILASAEISRGNMLPQIIEAGYDINHCRAKDLELLKMFN